MTRPRCLALGLIVFSLAVGTLSDHARKNLPLVTGGDRVLAVDFHVHSFPLSWATLAPWDTVLEAERHHLDAIAMTGHNHVWVGKVGAWFSRFVGGPTILVSEEIVTPTYHLLAVGVDHTIDWRLSSTEAIDEVHRQGGIAIAAHPLPKYAFAFDAKAMNELDGAEVLHPLAYVRPPAYVQFQQFFARGHFAAIGDSDYHGLGPLGMCRTYVFARDESPSAILAAVRARKTIVIDRDGRSYGDPELLRLALSDPAFQSLRSTEFEHAGIWIILSRLGGLAGLLILVAFA